MFNKTLSHLLYSSSLTIIVGSLLPESVIAGNFSRMYVFSDSLSETGNTLAITTAANAVNPLIPIVPFPTLGYVDGRFSNGDIWLDRLATRLDLPVPPISTFVGGNNSNGVNFSVNSATTGEAITFPIPLPGLVGLSQQLDQFKAANPVADPDALYIVWAGANDYFGGRVTDPRGPVNNLASAVQTLYDLGSRHFLVPNLPLLGQTPLAISRGEEVVNGLNQVTLGHNFLLSQSVETLSDLPGITVNLLDVASLFNSAISRPTDFGFRFVDTPCLVNSPLFNPPSTIPSICDNPDDYIFWDDLHPSSAAHQFVGDLAFKTLSTSTPEGSSLVGILSFAGLLGSWAMYQRLKRS